VPTAGPKSLDEISPRGGRAGRAASHERAREAARYAADECVRQRNEQSSDSDVSGNTLQRIRVELAANRRQRRARRSMDMPYTTGNAEMPTSAAIQRPQSKP
jgi:hypothetical protein